MLIQDTWADLADAYTSYRKITRSAQNQNTVRRFWKFLGLPEDTDVNSLGEAHEDAWRKVQWLNGPHALALYKAWSAQHDQSDIRRSVNST